VKLLATGAQEDEASRFLNGLIIARIPLFLFQAVQAALLPKLSALAEAGRIDEFRAGFRRLLMVVVGIGVVGTAGSLVIGPWVVRLLFGPEFDLGNRTMGLLAASSALFMLAIAMAQAVIALGGHVRMAASWVVGVGTFVVVTSFGNDLFLRVELGLLAGCAVAAACMAGVLVHRVRAGAPVEVEDLLEAIHELPLEP
jgi:O-antigen/teichoic acid export membrane protein